MTEKLAAHYENRTYYFYIVDKKPGELSIRMYDTPYIFIRKNDTWENHSTNKMAMTGPLIQIVAETAGAE
ncbi:hypothetical protein C8P68_10491 [Mucilaginibacter yixingensis]|uniref:Uncharacterized protein n=1 Tax=Mucilaginibacter yixingensis TaxID=1295612 RepID=A0A2T5J969_9SPHI|nr:hypothetical protein [Mucilaginibacter yixingensis]PTQ96606.1 hypothetical protein C8P68_10491 [Mucilaginibacter yixingensis]